MIMNRYITVLVVADINPQAVNDCTEWLSVWLRSTSDSDDGSDIADVGVGSRGITAVNTPSTVLVI